VVRGELEAYGAGLEDKLEIMAISRADLLDDKALAKLEKALGKASGARAHVISAATGHGVEPLLDAIVEHLGSEHIEDDGEAEPIEWSPL
jgi:GTP-binding protein